MIIDKREVEKPFEGQTADWRLMGTNFIVILAAFHVVWIEWEKSREAQQLLRMSQSSFSHQNYLIATCDKEQVNWASHALKLK